MARDQHGLDAEPGSEDDPLSNAEPSVEKMLEQVMRDAFPGWKGIETSGQAMAKQRNEQALQLKKQANDFRDCFCTPAGLRVLEHMLDTTLRASPYPVEAQLSMDVITPLVIAHDAQCNFVRAIFDAIRQAGPIASTQTDGEQDGRHRRTRSRPEPRNDGAGQPRRRRRTGA